MRVCRSVHEHRTRLRTGTYLHAPRFAYDPRERGVHARAVRASYSYFGMLCARNDRVRCEQTHTYPIRLGRKWRNRDLGERTARFIRLVTRAPFAQRHFGWAANGQRTLGLRSRRGNTRRRCAGSARRFDARGARGNAAAPVRRWTVRIRRGMLVTFFDISRAQQRPGQPYPLSLLVPALRTGGLPRAVCSYAFALLVYKNKTVPV